MNSDSHKSNGNKALHHIYDSNIPVQGRFYYDYISKLENDAADKLYKKNAKDEPLIRSFKPSAVLFLVDSKCVYGNGHSSLLFLNNKGDGIYYNAADLRDISGALKGDNIKFLVDRKVLSESDVKYLLKNGHFSKEKGGDMSNAIINYDKFISIPLETIKEGKIALQKADEIYHKPGLYNLYERNCNHITQEILREIGKDFSPVKGSAELVVKNFNLLVEKLKKMDIVGAHHLISNTIEKIGETGAVPNVSYKKGVEFAKQRNYVFGKLPINNIALLTYQHNKNNLTVNNKNKSKSALEKAM